MSPGNRTAIGMPAHIGHTIVGKSDVNVRQQFPVFGPILDLSLVIKAAPSDLFVLLGYRYPLCLGDTNSCKGNTLAYSRELDQWLNRVREFLSSTFTRPSFSEGACAELDG